MRIVIIEWESKGKTIYTPVILPEPAFKTPKCLKFSDMDQIREFRKGHLLKDARWIAFDPVYHDAWEVV